MSLAHAVLGVLSIRPSSGYDIKKLFDRTIGLVWNADYSQIYVQLRRLEQEGLLCKESVVQEGKPNKNVYTVADPGLEELRRWLSAPTEISEYKDVFALRFFFFDHVDDDVVRRHLEEARLMIRGKLTSVEAEEARTRQRIESGQGQRISLFRLRSAELGKRLSQSYLEWIDETLSMLETGDLRRLESKSSENQRADSDLTSSALY